MKLVKKKNNFIDLTFIVFQSEYYWHIGEGVHPWADVHPSSLDTKCH